MRVALVGTAGIGEHHAKWYDMEGCDVVAVVGTTSESVARAVERLEREHGFRGRGYCNLEEMLHQARPDAVSVCSPNECHHEHALASLRHDAHVMVEKPMVWHPSGDTETILRLAQDILACGGRTGCIAAVNTQYVAALDAYEALYRHERGAWEPVGSIFMEMESRGGRRGARSHEDIWVDLAPHPLSLLLRWAPEGELDPDSVDCRAARREVDASFTYGRSRAHIVLRYTAEGTPRRRFGVNDLLVDVEGRPDEQGVFCTYLRRGDRETKLPDLVHTSIQHFVHACQGRGHVLVSAEEGCRNLALQCALFERVRRSEGPEL